MPQRRDQGRGAATTHFGFQEVPEEEKPSRVRGVFASVAPRYDLMNDLMSAGIHRLWRSALIDWLNPRPGMSLVDMAGGTADIALRAIDRVGPARAGPVAVCDSSPEMLETGRSRAIDRGLVGRRCAGGLSWVCGAAEDLPFASCRFDAYTIAFGLRNVTRIGPALREARRVLRPGGRFLCLEFSRVVLPALSGPYDLYSFRVLPALGAAVANDAAAYRYLAESIRRFPAQDQLAAMMTEAGFAQVRYRNLTGGIAALHSGWRI